MRDLAPRALRDNRRDRPLFVDRDAERRLARETLLHGGNVLVVGERGMGKSSLLRFLAADVEASGRRALFVDGRVPTSARELLGVIRDVAEARGLTRREDGTVADGPRADVRALSRARTDAQLLLDELEALRAVLAEIEPAVVVLDDVPSPEVAHTLFGRLRDELWELPLSWCVGADERERGSFVAPPADAFWTRIVELDRFDEATARELLHRRLGDERPPPGVVDRLVAEGGGNPRRLLSLAYDVLVDGAATDEVLGRWAERDRRAGDVGEPARRLLAELEAGGPASPSDTSLLARLGWSRGRAAQVFKELEDAGLVLASTKPGRTGRPRRVYEVAR